MFQINTLGFWIEIEMIKDDKAIKITKRSIDTRKYEMNLCIIILAHDCVKIDLIE